MWFRARLIVQAYRSRGEGLTVRVDDVEVTVHETQHPRDAGNSVILAEALTERVASPVVEAFLAALDATLSSDKTPDDVLDYCAQLSSELSGHCRRVVELTRWRWRSDSSHSPYAHVGSEFSSDGVRWRQLPGRMNAHARLGRGLVLNDIAATSVQELLDAVVSEPVAHQLLREAKDVAYSHPRSAVVIGVAAVESGFKHLVADLVPDAAWLAENVPSPPVVRMLREYLPTLPVRLKIDGTVHGPPKYVRALLTSAVEERNRVTHTGRGQIDGPAAYDQLHDALAAIQDSLYLFDHYSGHAWALAEVGEKFRGALGT